jgi:hypothetical protein
MGLRAFISYRRQDAFMVDAGGNDFVQNLECALRRSGFADVFVDTDPHTGISVGDDYLSRIYDAVFHCDLLVAVIGTKWIEILEEKSHLSERDSVIYEISTAFQNEKEVVPVLVDGAKMPDMSRLPIDIRELKTKQAKETKSNSSAKAIVSALCDPISTLVRFKKLDSGWTWTYVVLSVLAYYFCAVNPYVIGAREFGYETWLSLALVWSGLYLWPIFFLPFILVAFYRPLRTLIECAINAGRWQDAMTYSSPLIAGTILALLGTVMEVSPPEVPWTVHPTGPRQECQAGQAIANGAADHNDLKKVTSYDPMRDLENSMGHKFWLTDKCWPNVFFYLTVPMLANTTNEVYFRERRDVLEAFNSILGDKRTPHSRLFPHYIAAVAILLWLMAVGTLMSIFYVTVKIRRAHDGRVREIPSEDAYLCLTYAFIALVIWLPFRVNTLHIKALYSPMDLGTYFKDIVLAIVFLIVYIYLTLGLLVKYHRLVLALLGSAATILILSVAISVLWFAEPVARLSENWQAFVGVAILAIIILFALWYQFDPAVVRRKDSLRRDEGTVATAPRQMNSVGPPPVPPDLLRD